ncbi:MAG: GNAT family protein [Acidimicrobiales bacterium]
MSCPRARRTRRSSSPRSIRARSCTTRGCHPRPRTPPSSLTYSACAPANFGFLLRAAGELVGVVNLNDVVMGALKSAYLGYYAFKGSENKGLMAEGLGLVIELAFGELGLHRVEANIQPANLASIRLAQKVGLTKEGFSERYLYVAGQWRDHERWAMTAESLGAFNLRTAPSPPGDIQALGER